MPRRPTADRRPIAELSDAELLEGLRSGSEAHFNELYGRHFDRVYRFAFQRLRNHADAEEVAQETFTAVFRSITAFRGDSALLTWIFGIARNTVNNHLRRARLESERLEALEAEEWMPLPSLAACGPFEQLALRRYVGAIEDRLGGLSAWQLDVFRLRHEENLPIREIARRTDRTGDAIRSALYRVKRALVEAVEAQRGARGAGPAAARSWSAA